VLTLKKTIRAQRDRILSGTGLTVLFLDLLRAPFLQDGETPLMLAARYGHVDAMQALLDAGADRYAEVRMTPCSPRTAHEIIISMG
jgi:ankyrin repeat protein